MAYHNEIPFTQELLRKGIHLISLSIPLGYLCVTKQTALIILSVLAILAVIIDLLIKQENYVQKFIYFLFGGLFRSHEREKKLVFNGATWVLVSAVLTVLLFPKFIAITAFSILIISDICAAIFGRKFGRHKLFNKSWEGTFAFFLSALIVILVLGFSFNAPWTYFMFGIAGSVIGAFVEAASSVIKIDDNFSIPLTIGAVLWIGGILSAGLNAPFMNLL